MFYLFLQNHVVFANDFADVGLPIITNFNQDDYNAHHANWDIQQADNGLIYIANGNSVLEYDGEVFNRYDIPNNTAVRELDVHENKVYIGSLNNIGFFQANEKGILKYNSLNDYIDEKYHPFGEVYSVTAFNNKVIFKAYENFFIWDGNSIRTILDDTKSFANIIDIDNELHIKLMGDETVYNIDLNAKNILKPSTFILPKKAKVKAMALTDTGNKVFFTAHHGLFKQDGEALTKVDGILDQDEFIYDAIKTDNGHYYVTTINAGIFILSKDFKLLKNYREIHGLKINQVMATIQDQQQNIWSVGYKGINVMRPPDEVSHYAQDSNMYAFNFTSIQNKPSFVGKRIQQLKANKSNPLYPPKFTKVGDVEGIRSVLDIADKTLLCTNNGLYIVKIQDHEIIEKELIFNESQYVFDIAATDDFSHVFISTHIGVYHLQQNQGQWQAQLVQGLGFEINNIEVQDNKVLWVGTRTSELYRLKIEGINTSNQVLTKFNKKDGVGDNLVIPFKLKNSIVFGTSDGTIAYQQADKKLHTVNDLPKIFNTENQSVEFLYQDDAQRIWYTIGDYMGFAQKEKNKWITNENIFKYFPARLNSNYISVKPDILWFMQTGGEIYRLDVNKAKKIPVLGSLYIRQVQNAITEKTIQAGLITKLNNELDFKSNSIRVNYALVDFATPNKALYRTKLNGSHNPQWSKWSKETYKDFTELRGNNYTLEVQAKDGFGRITESTKLSFKVLPPFYLSTTALIIYAFLALLILTLTAWLVQRWRTKKLQAHNVELATLVDKKTIEIQGHVEELEQQQELKTRFFTNISHELRTPLSLIILPLQKLIKYNQKTLDTESKELLTLSLKNANGMKQLVNEVLDVSRFEEKSMPIAVQKSDLVDFVENNAKQFNQWATQNNQRIRVDKYKGKLELYFDRQMMGKIISNLLTNAIKYSGKETAIALSFFSNDENAGFIVKDNGVGIAKDKCQQVFERYFKDDKNTSKYDSSGIGLAFVKEMVELHHGKITLNSDTGCGCEFTLSFKQGHDHYEHFVPAQVEQQENSEQITNQSHPDDTAVVMIVEDNTDLRDFVSKSLSLDYKVIQAINGVDALQTLTHELPDLIISDIMMPQMDGIEFLQKLRQQPQFKTIPFFLLSSKSTQSDTQVGLQYGADDYLTKPFDMDELLLRVKNMINSRKLVRMQVQQQLQEIKQQDTIQITGFEKKVRDIILENISDSHFNVSSLASAMGLERSALFRKAKKELHISPSKYIQQVRLEIAKELLEKESISVSEVAYASGFESLSYFSKTFKLKFGLAPSAITS